MDLSIPVVSLILISIVSGIWCLHVHRETYPCRLYTWPTPVSRLLISASYLRRHLWCFLFTTQTAEILKSEKNESAVAYSGLSSIKCQHHVADIAYLPVGKPASCSPFTTDIFKGQHFHAFSLLNFWLYLMLSLLKDNSLSSSLGKCDTLVAAAMFVFWYAAWLRLCDLLASCPGGELLHLAASHYRTGDRLLACGLNGL